MDAMTLKLKLGAEGSAGPVLQLDTAVIRASTWGSLAQTAVNAGPVTKARGGRFGFAPAVVATELLERDIDGNGTAYRQGGIAACAAGDIEAVQGWVANGWDPARAVDKNGSNGLMWAAGAGSIEVCDYLVAHGGLDLEAVNKKGRTALMQAAKAGHLEVTVGLIRAGSDPTVSASDGSGLFEYATLGGSLEVLEYLSQSVPELDVCNRNTFGCTAAHWAAAAGNLVVCKWLRNAGFDFDLLNHGGHGPVNVAAFKGHTDVLEWLLVNDDGPKLTRQLYTRDKQGRTTSQELKEKQMYPKIAAWLDSLSDL